MRASALIGTFGSRKAHRGSGVDVQTNEQIRLMVPASVEYARIARITTSGIATRLGFSIDDVEQLKVAMGEVWSLLVGDGRKGELTVTYGIEPEALVVDVTSNNGALPLDETSLEVTSKLLNEVVDVHHLASDGRHAHLRKHRAHAR
jgi:serine/threonine-protein kinase RsbW